MNTCHPSSKAALLAGLLVLVTMLVSSVHYVSAQSPLSSLVGKDEKAEQPADISLPSGDAEIDKAIADLIVRQNQIKAAMNRPEKSEDQRVLLSELRRLLEQQETTLRDLKKLRLTIRDREKEMSEWRGFTERPPQPLSVMESLRETYYSEVLEKQLIEFRAAYAGRLLDDYTRKLTKDRAELRSLEESLQRARGKADERDLAARLETARLRVEIGEVGVTTFAYQRLAAEEALRAKRAYVAFLEKKISAAREAFPISKEDLDEKIKSLSAKAEEIEKLINRAVRDDDTLRDEMRRADQALARARGAADGRSTGPNRESLAALQATYDLVSARLESVRSRIESLRGIREMIDYEKYIWQEWYALGQKREIEDIDKKIKEIDQRRTLMEGWKRYIDIRLENVFTQINNQRQRLQSPDLPRSERDAARQMIEVYGQRVSDLQEVARYLLSIQQLSQGLAEDLKKRQAAASSLKRIRSNLDAAWGIGKAVWNAELYVVEDTVIVDGRKISTPRSVTLGKMIQALALLIVGLWLARRLLSPIKKAVARRLSLDDNQKDQFGKVLYMIMFFAVLVSSFMFARIPLAVFAFLGGALAIGVGFGAQNIINNFISGIILMFDKSIRVGDIVEVDGQGGKVTSIGMRSSHIVRFDGIEMLVPNSQFLQQKVTNWTLTKNQIRFQITVGVAYGAQTRDVVKLLTQAADEHPLILKNPAPTVIFHDFGDNALIFNLLFWIELGPGVNGLVVSSDLRHRIYELFNQAGIVISFPQRDVHLDTISPLEVKVVPAAQPQERPHG